MTKPCFKKKESAQDVIDTSALHVFSGSGAAKRYIKAANIREFFNE